MSDANSRDEGLAFFGKIVAGQCHDVTNVLNIVNELAGLQQDVLHAAGDSRSVDIAKLRQVGEKIRFQVARGGTIIKNIHRFAHSVDLPVSVFDVNETLSRIVFLAERWTRLNKSRLVSDLPRETTVLEANPFLFVQSVFMCIDAFLLSKHVEQTITVSYSSTGNGVRTVVASSHPMPSDKEVEAKIAGLRALLDRLDGELEALPEGGQIDHFVFIVSNKQRRSHNGPADITEDC